MSNQDFDPSTSVYLPRVPTKPPTERYCKIKRTTTSTEQLEQNYFWNRPSEVATVEGRKPFPEAAIPPPTEAISSIERLLEQRLQVVEKIRREGSGSSPVSLTIGTTADEPALSADGADTLPQKRNNLVPPPEPRNATMLPSRKVVSQRNAIAHSLVSETPNLPERLAASAAECPKIDSDPKNSSSSDRTPARSKLALPANTPESGLTAPHIMQNANTPVTAGSKLPLSPPHVPVVSQFPLRPELQPGTTIPATGRGIPAQSNSKNKIVPPTETYVPQLTEDHNSSAPELAETLAFKGHSPKAPVEIAAAGEPAVPAVRSVAHEEARKSSFRGHITIPAPIEAPKRPYWEQANHELDDQIDRVELEETPRIPVSRVWGIDYHALTMDQTLEEIRGIVKRRVPSVAITANLNYSMLCDANPRLRKFTSKAALVLCDGKPIQWRSKLTSTPLPERVAGSDLIYRLAELSQETDISIYLFGAAPGVAEKTSSILRRTYPGCNIAGYHCPSFHDQSVEEKQRQIAQIRKAKPDILLVALGQPKGEYWIEEHLAELHVPLCIQVGATFDFVTGIAKRAPKFMQKIGAEWLYRMLTDPKRLAPRYFKNAIYLLKILRRECIDALDTKPQKPARRPLR